MLKINYITQRFVNFYLYVLKLLSKSSYINYHTYSLFLDIVLFIECVSRYSNGIIISLARQNHLLFL